MFIEIEEEIGNEESNQSLEEFATEAKYIILDSDPDWARAYKKKHADLTRKS